MEHTTDLEKLQSAEIEFLRGRVAELSRRMMTEAFEYRDLALINKVLDPVADAFHQNDDCLKQKVIISLSVWQKTEIHLIHLKIINMMKLFLKRNSAQTQNPSSQTASIPDDYKPAEGEGQYTKKGALV